MNDKPRGGQACFTPNALLMFGGNGIEIKKERTVGKSAAFSTAYGSMTHSAEAKACHKPGDYYKRPINKVPFDTIKTNMPSKKKEKSEAETKAEQEALDYKLDELFLLTVNNRAAYEAIEPIITQSFDVLMAKLEDTLKDQVRYTNKDFSIGLVSAYNSNPELRTKLLKALIKYYLEDKLIDTNIRFPEPTNMQNNSKLVVKQTVVRGEVIEQMNEDVLIGRIAGLQNEKKNLEALKSNSKRIAKKIAELDGAIAAIEAEIDSRDPAE